ncbi:MAG: GTP-binding protein [Betaproteobacteria bacterium]|nr:GTP-binding protein [Betaproteobacteria bacterium]
MIPVSVITGFLGSGKTTLLRHLLRDPAMARTAVIMNEFGEVGLDHDLIETSDESFVQLTTGCLCCKVRSDLVVTLADLAARRAAGTLSPFDRVVIETTGLADPAPVLHALMTDRDLAEVYALGSVVATADAVVGLETLDRHEQSLRQAAVADCIVVTKTDLPQARTAALKARLAALNPGATVLSAVPGALGPEVLFEAGVYDPAARLPQVQAWLAAESTAADGGATAHAHEDGITSFCLVRGTPVRAVALALFLEALADNCGADLLRVKGIVHVAEQPDRPAVVHGVQHVFHPPVWLDRWPSGDRRTRIVFIVQDIPMSWARGLLDLLDAEVADESARQGH